MTHYKKAVAIILLIYGVFVFRSAMYNILTFAANENTEWTYIIVREVIDITYYFIVFALGISIAVRGIISKKIALFALILPGAVIVILSYIVPSYIFPILVNLRKGITGFGIFAIVIGLACLRKKKSY